MNIAVKLSVLLFAIICLSSGASAFYAKQPPAKQQGDTSIVIPLGGNAWRTGKDTLGGKITNDGIVGWSNPDAGYTVYIRFRHKGKLTVYMNMSVPEGR